MEHEADNKRRQREEEEEAKKSKGKGKLEDSPIPSPRLIEFPKLPYNPRDYEEELKAKLQQEEENHQEELATLNALLDHYKREANEAKASRKEYEAKWLEASQKITQQDKMIAKLAQEGVEMLPEQHMENLKEAMRHMWQENKDLNEKYQQVSSTYEDIVLKEPNTGENKLLKTMLKKVHEKCIKAKEAYQQAME